MYIIEWQFLKELDINNIFEKDCNYNIVGAETYRIGPDMHLTDDVITLFEKNKIIVIFNKDLVISTMIVIRRICDPFFNHKNILINNKSFKFIKRREENNEGYTEYFLEEEDVYNQIKDELFTCNEIIIIPEENSDFEYARSLLLYPIKNTHNDNYFLYKELDRWEGVLK